MIWPFNIVSPSSSLAKNTVKQIQKKLIKNDGLYRYEQDEYDGWMYLQDHRKKQAGYWPLLNFWLAIVLSKMGRYKEAQKYYFKIVNSFDRFIPEQVFENNLQKSVSPLAGSHAMFILASKELKLI